MKVFWEQPLSLHQFHKRFMIRDARGNNVFEINLIRPSLESWKELEDIGNVICGLMNGEFIVMDDVIVESKDVGAKKAEKVIEKV